MKTDDIMPRYLTPAKIALLALIELYTAKHVPTASTIPVLSFITSKILPSSLPKPRNVLPYDQDKSHEQGFVTTAQDFEELLSALPAAPGRTLWDLFVRKLWDIDSLDALHEFFDRKSLLLARTEKEPGITQPAPDDIILSRTSPFGVFVRRAQLEFARLNFQDTTRLWTSYLTWRKKYTTAGDWAVADERELATVAYVACEQFVSTDDVEKLLEFQVEQMQSTYTPVLQGKTVL